jgi:hypothetical protein
MSGIEGPKGIGSPDSIKPISPVRKPGDKPQGDSSQELPVDEYIPSVPEDADAPNQTDIVDISSEGKQ